MDNKKHGKLDLWRKFRFFNDNFWQKHAFLTVLWFLTEIWIFDQNFDFSLNSNFVFVPSFRFLIIITITLNFELDKKYLFSLYFIKKKFNFVQYRSIVDHPTETRVYIRNPDFNFPKFGKLESHPGFDLVIFLVTKTKVLAVLNHLEHELDCLSTYSRSMIFQCSGFFGAPCSEIILERLFYYLNDSTSSSFRDVKNSISLLQTQSCSAPNDIISAYLTLVDTW